MITIACPKCSAKLRVDPAFQGLTCRCTHCQSLLAIPSDAARMPVRLAPEPSGSSRAGGKSRAGGTSRGGSSRAGRSAAAATAGSTAQLQDVYGAGGTAPSLQVAKAPRGGGGAGGGGTPEPLITLERRRRRGPGHRNAVLAGAGVAAALMVGLGVVLVVLIANRSGVAGPDTAWASSTPAPVAATPPRAPTPAPPAPVAPVAPDAPAVDPDNPHGWSTPTVLGQPLAGHTAVLVDAVEQSRPWMGSVNRSLLETLSKPGQDETVSVFYVHDGEVSALPRQPLRPGRAVRSSLARLQREAPAAGKKGFYDGLNAALDARPDHVLVITGRQEWDKAADYVLSLVQKAPSKPTFNVVSMGGENADLDRIAAATGGVVEPLEASTVRGWLR